MVIAVARSAWRWLALLYPAATTLAVVVTANHYWMDGIVAARVLAVALLAQHGLERLAARYARPRLSSDQADQGRISVSADASRRNADSAAGLFSMRQS
jgi:hypothetical protein